MERPTTNSHILTTTHPLIVIVGETASGKSALALELAERYNGEIICADSRTIYRGMDIGTAKPSMADQARVPHHLLDIRDPNEPFNVSTYQGLTLVKIGEITEGGKLPILVGGTGLYIDSVIFGYTFGPKGAEKDGQNPRHLKIPNNSARTPLRPNTLVIGLDVPKKDLDKRIAKRVGQMFASGLEQEAKTLSEHYGWEAPSMTAVGYREWQAYFAGIQNLEETKELVNIHSRQYAKRQRTWFNRNEHIIWLSKSSDVHQIMMQFLQQNK